MKTKFIIVCLVALCSTTHLFAGTLDFSDQDIIDDERARYTEGISISRLAKQIGIMEPDEREDIDTLNLGTNVLTDQGLREVVEKLLPLLPHLKQLDLSFAVIGCKELEGLAGIISILRSCPNLEYVNLWGNGLADEIAEFLETGEDEEGIKAQITQKVIVYPTSLVKAKSVRLPKPLEKFPQWRETHYRFYQQLAD